MTLWAEGRCLIIAEIAQAHDGSLGMAHAYIDVAARAGAGAVKFQTHIAAAESTPAEQWRVKFSPQDRTRYDYWKRMEFTEEQWHGLKAHADERGLLFLSSPFSMEAVDLLTRVGVPAWKVASGELSNTAMLDRMIESRRPMILSSGMSPIEELDGAVEAVQARELPLAVLQCTSAYPCPAERVGINLLPYFAERYGCAVGLSDHSGTIYAGLAAATLGAQVLEVHVTMSREMFGPDVVASLTSTELRELVHGVRFIERMRAHPIDKDAEARTLAPLRDLFTKSLVSRTAIPAGTVLAAEHVSGKKPGTGIPIQRLEQVLGRRLRRAVPADTLLSEEDFE